MWGTEGLNLASPVYSSEMYCTLCSSFFCFPVSGCVCREGFLWLFCDPVPKQFSAYVPDFLGTLSFLWMPSNSKHTPTKKELSFYKVHLLFCEYYCKTQWWISNHLSSPAVLLFVIWSSASCSSSLLHSPSWQRNHARGERQHYLCGSRLPYAIREVDAGSRRPDPWGWHAYWPKRAGADWRAAVQQLHVRGHVNARRDWGCGTDYCERWVYQSLNEGGVENRACEWQRNVYSNS